MYYDYHTSLFCRCVIVFHIAMQYVLYASCISSLCPMNCAYFRSDHTTPPLSVAFPLTGMYASYSCVSFLFCQAGEKRTQEMEMKSGFDQDISLLDNKKEELASVIRKYVAIRQHLNEKITAHVSKNTNNGLEEKIKHMFLLYIFLREVYHGGDFNGVNRKKIISQAVTIMAEIEEMLKSCNREDAEFSDEGISDICNDCATVLT